MITPLYYNSGYRIICEAMFEAGYLGLGVEPNSEHLAKYQNTLNDLFMTLQTQGLKLWLNEDFSIVPVQGQSLYSLGPASALIATKPMRVIEGYFVDQSANRRPVIPISRQEWDSLSTIIQQGTITSYFVDKQQLNLNVYLWLTPDLQATLGVMHAVIQTQVAQQVSLTDAMNFPIEWFLTLKWGLADQICGGQPQAIMNRCSSMAAKYLMMLEDWDVEDASTSFAPDSRSFNQTGMFR